MSVTKDPRSGIYSYEFRFAGHRHRGSAKTRSKREAEAEKREVRARGRDEHRANNCSASELILTDAAARYVFEIGADQEIERQLGPDLQFLGADTRIIDVTGDDIAKLVAWLRGQHKWGRADMPLLSPAR